MFQCCHTKLMFQCCHKDWSKQSRRKKEEDKRLYWILGDIQADEPTFDSQKPLGQTGICISKQDGGKQMDTNSKSFCDYFSNGNRLINVPDIDSGSMDCKSE